MRPATCVPSVACFTASIVASVATVCANSRGATLIVSSAGCAIAAVAMASVKAPSPILYCIPCINASLRRS